MTSTPSPAARRRSGLLRQRRRLPPRPSSNEPDEIALDSSFDLYIADTGNDRVREVSASTAHISAYAGNGTTLADTGNSGPALASGLYQPSGIATDTMGDLFIADEVNNRVQEMAASSHTQFGISMTAGDVYTVAGGGPGNVGSGFGGPATGTSIGADFGVALDSAGDLYVTNLSEEVLEAPATSGTHWGISMTADDIYDIAGSYVAGYSGDGGPATSAHLFFPTGVVFDSAGDLYSRRRGKQPRPGGRLPLRQPVGDRHDSRRHLYRGGQFHGRRG